MVDRQAAQQMADSMGLKYFETSARMGENVDQAVGSLLEQVAYSFLTLGF